MSWKDFLFFSKGERNGILILICLIILVLGLNIAMPYFFQGDVEDISSYRMEIEKFKSSLKPINDRPEQSISMMKSTLFRFDPNKLDSTGFVKLGIPSYLVIRILKYRAKGGVFRCPEDFSKIYGMKNALYEELSPYIFIADAGSDLPKEKKIKEIAVERKEKPIAYKNEIIELNTSDTTHLKSLKGVGSVYAGRIVKYRDYLGGFYQVEQLREVYGVSEELFLSLRPYLTVEESQIKKIRLNHGDLNERLRHPYLKKEQIRALILFLQKNRTISSFEMLRELTEFSDNDWNRLLPYLSLE